jgi:putative flippase GtrA
MLDKKSEWKRFILFCIVGLVNTVVDITLYFFLHQFLGFPAFVASPITVIAVMTFSYYLNSKFVFKNELNLNKYLKFMLFTGAGVIVIQTLLSTFFEHHVQAAVIQLGFSSNQGFDIFVANSLTRISGIFFSLIWNYFFYKLLVFENVYEPEVFSTQAEANTDKQ